MNIKSLEIMCDLLRGMIAKIEELEAEIDKLRSAQSRAKLPSIKPGPDDFPPGWVTGETP